MGGGGVRGKLSEKFELSVHTSALVINRWLNISSEEASVMDDLLSIVKK